MTNIISKIENVKGTSFSTVSYDKESGVAVITNNESGAELKVSTSLFEKSVDPGTILNKSKKRGLYKVW